MNLSRLSSFRPRRIILTPPQFKLACREPYRYFLRYKKYDSAICEPSGAKRWISFNDIRTHEAKAGAPKIAPTKAQIDAARTWLERLDIDTIPKSETEVTMSRSSGPGGQNVNKVNSKVTLRVRLSAIEKHTPKLIHDALRTHPWYAKNSDSILIKADSSRYKKQNQDHAYQKLAGLLRATAESMIPGETLESQRHRVRELKDEFDRERKQFKIMLSDKKASRRTKED